MLCLYLPQNVPRSFSTTVHETVTTPTSDPNVMMKLVHTTLSTPHSEADEMPEDEFLRLLSGNRKKRTIQQSHSPRTHQVNKYKKRTPSRPPYTKLVYGNNNHLIDRKHEVFNPRTKDVTLSSRSIGEHYDNAVKYLRTNILEFIMNDFNEVSIRAALKDVLTKPEKVAILGNILTQGIEQLSNVFSKTVGAHIK